MAVPQWLVKVVRNLEGKKVALVEGGVGTSREISCFVVFTKKNWLVTWRGWEGYDLPSQFGTTTYSPEITQHVPCLAQRNIDSLRIGKVGYVIKKHGKSGSEWKFRRRYWGSAATMDAARGSEVCWGDECDLETRLGVEYVVGEGGVEERWSGCWLCHLRRAV